jgi:hypothetical protein
MMLRAAPVMPSLDDIAALAQAAFAELPGEFRALTGNIVFAVEDFPDSETVRALGLHSGYELLGLFHGAPLAFHVANMAGPEPTRISLIAARSCVSGKAATIRWPTSSATCWCTRSAIISACPMRTCMRSKIPPITLRAGSAVPAYRGFLSAQACWRTA